MGRSRKDPHSPHGGNFCCPEGEGETKLFLIIVNVLGHPKGVRGLTSNFLRGGGMDVFWNDPISGGKCDWDPPSGPNITNINLNIVI